MYIFEIIQDTPLHADHRTSRMSLIAVEVILGTMTQNPHQPQSESITTITTITTTITNLIYYTHKPNTHIPARRRRPKAPQP